MPAIDVKSGESPERPLPKVSVIVPTFNREKWLPVSLGSVRQQSFHDWELLVVDDASTDGTWSLLQEMATADPRIRPLKNARTKGVSGARNTGIDAARGEYLAFLDSDDEWSSEHLARSIARIEAESTGAERIDATTALAERRFRNSGELFGEKGDFHAVSHVHPNGTARIDSEEVIRQYLAGGCPLEIQTLVIRQNSLQDVRFPEELSMGEDSFFHLMCLYSDVKFLRIPEVHVTMWAHEANSTSAGGRSLLPEERIRMHESYEAYGRKLLTLPLSKAQRRTVIRTTAIGHFWQIGYHGHLAAGRTRRAFQCFREAIRMAPGMLSLYRSYASVLLQHYLNSTGILGGRAR